MMDIDPTDTTDPSYWLNWRFLLCALFVLGSMLFASLLIWKYEGAEKSKDGRRERQQVTAGVLYKDEVWKTCLNGIHPAWLLAFRIFAFLVLLALITANIVAVGPSIFLYYTQLTFALTTIYFGLASLYSLYGCWHDHAGASHFNGTSHYIDMEQASYTVPMLKSLNNHEEVHAHQIASLPAYLLQILYQVSAGAVVLTDAIFWLIIYPFLSASDFRLNFYHVTMHSVNILVFGDTMLNCMRFPMFRISYFMLWTALFVIGEWIIHAFVNLYWPYPFMELSSSYAPLWYTLVGVLHFPCYGGFALLVKLKHLWLSRVFPDSIKL